MPVTHKPLASAMVTPTRSITVSTTAGRTVQFRNGVAVIYDTRDLPYLLRRADVKLEVSEYAMSWMPDAVAEAGEVKAQVHWPEQPVEPAEADPLEDAIRARVRNAKGQWLGRPSNSSAS